MAAGDQAGPAPKGGIPLWLIIVGGGAVALFLFMRARSGQATGTGGSLVPGVTTDPNTGLPIDPLTGLPYVSNPQSPATNESWFNGALQWATTHNISPSLANQALYDYINGQLLNGNESGVIDKILGGYGAPPTPLPFGGNPVLPHPQPVPLKQVLVSTSKLSGPTRQFVGPQTPTPSADWLNQEFALLQKSGLAQRRGNQWFTTRKFTGNERPITWTTATPTQAIADVLVKYGVLAPVQVKAA